MDWRFLFSGGLMVYCLGILGLAGHQQYAGLTLGTWRQFLFYPLLMGATLFLSGGLFAETFDDDYRDERKSRYFFSLLGAFGYIVPIALSNQQVQNWLMQQPYGGSAIRFKFYWFVVLAVASAVGYLSWDRRNRRKKSLSTTSYRRAA